MKKTVFIFAVILACIFSLAACTNALGEEETTAHVCSFGEWKITKNSTCIEKGTRERVCECGEKQVEEIALSDHTEATKEAVAPTCIASGLTECKYCSICDEILVEAQVVEALGHVAHDDGYCSNCDEPIRPSMGVEYEISADGTYATVKSYVSESTRLIIAEEYEGVPVTAIAEYAFADRGLTKIVVPDSIIFVGKYAFSGCEAICETVDGVTYVGAIAIAFDDSVKDVTLRDGTRVVSDYAFYQARSFTSLTLPDSVKTLGEYAFENCNSLINVNVGEKSQLFYIGEYCFRYCFSLKQFDLPQTLTELCEGAFYSCEKLESVAIPAGVEVISNYVFHNCRKINSLTISEGVTFIGNGAFGGCISIGSVAIPDSVTGIGGGAFSNGNYNSHALTTVTFGEGSRLRSIGGYAFEECENLKSIVIPAGVSSIGEAAFKDCGSLISVTFMSNNTLEKIEDRVFYNCASLQSIEIPETVTSIGVEAFYCCNLIASVKIPDAVTTICDYAFSTTYGADKALTSVVFGENSRLTSIGEEAFARNNKLASIAFPANLVSIGERAFSACVGLQSIAFAENGKLESIGRNAFGYCTSLKNVVLPETVTSIGTDLFMECTGLESVTLPSSATKIESGTFQWCRGLKSYTVPEGITAIDSSAFYDCTALERVIISDGVLTVGDWVFSSCANLKSITIPASVTSFGGEMMIGCEALTDIHYGGTVEQWQAIDKGYRWDDNTGSYTVHCIDGDISK